MPYVALLITTIIWGLSAIVAKEAFTEINPYILLFLRFAIASIVVSPLIFVKRDQPDIRTRDIPKLVFLSFLATSIGAGGWVVGLFFTTATRAAIITAIGPLLILPLERLILKKSEKPVVYIASAVAFIGALLVILKPIILGEQTNFTNSMLIGDLLVFLSAFATALYTVLVQKDQRQYHSYQKTALGFTVGWLTALPFALVAHHANPEWVTTAGPKTWLSVLYFGLGSSAIAYLLWQWAVEKVSPVGSSLMFYLQPIITIIAALLILHETPSPIEIAGGLIILIAVATVLFVQNRKPKEKVYNRIQ